MGLVLAFGAGSLIAGISFELYESGHDQAGAGPVAVGLAIGALSYFFADRAVEGWTRKQKGEGSAGVPLALGALLDGIPEQAVLGIGLAAGGVINPAMLLAIFVSNLPEAIGSSSDMFKAGKSRNQVLVLWIAVSALCTVATIVGFMIADHAGREVQASINGFAAGALLVMLVDSMAPEAQNKAPGIAGLATALGFAATAALSLAD
ncbi:ZIP family metal transporter [Corynebacterium heidelbergense]|uniref:ZIP family metal transporter n=1 Tax=Corynebacterium heidelbergense TaxID=2055947 RepID=UPI003083818C